MQILVRTVHTVQQTVEISQGQFLVLLSTTRPLLCNDRCLGWGRTMLRSTMDTCYASSRVGFWKNFTIFHMQGFSRILSSVHVLLFSLKWPRTSSTTAVACSILVFVVLAHLALSSHDCPQSAEKCTVSALVAHEMHLEICTLFLRVSYIFQHFSVRNFLRESFFGALEH